MIFRYIRILCRFVALAVCMMLPVSCHDADPEEPTDGGTMNLAFRMITAGTTRASESDDLHDEAESEFTVFEDGVDLEDLGLFIFAAYEGTTDPEEEILVVKSTGMPLNGNVWVSGIPGAYTVNVDIKKGELHNSLKTAGLDPADTRKIRFRLLVLANCSSPGTNAQAKWNAVDGGNYKKVIEQLQTWTYAMSYIYNANCEGEDVRQLYKNRKENCPMFGTAISLVTQKAICESSPQNRVFLGEINLLRALAKIRVVDNIAKDTDGYPKIAGAEFLGSQDLAAQLPYDALNYQDGRQVHMPNIAVPANILNPTAPCTYRLGLLPLEWTNIPSTLRTGDVRIAYVPEQQIGTVDGDVYPGRPVIRIVIALGSGESEKETFDISMKSYGLQTFDFGENILRNHIYTLSVNGIKPGEVVVKARVSEWITYRHHIEL